LEWIWVGELSMGLELGGVSERRDPS